MWALLPAASMSSSTEVSIGALETPSRGVLCKVRRSWGRSGGLIEKCVREVLLSQEHFRAHLATLQTPSCRSRR
jgi:hypothetical protein